MMLLNVRVVHSLIKTTALYVYDKNCGRNSPSRIMISDNRAFHVIVLVEGALEVDTNLIADIRTLG